MLCNNDAHIMLVEYHSYAIELVIYSLVIVIHAYAYGESSTSLAITLLPDHVSSPIPSATSQENHHSQP